MPSGSLSPINLSRVKLQRPLSTDFKRTISAIEAERLSHLTHRRTQSYADSTNHIRQLNSSKFDGFIVF